MAAARDPAPRCCLIPRVVRRRRESQERRIGSRSSIADVWGTLHLAGETALIIRRLIVPFTVAIVAAHAGQSLAQGAFPAPLPGQAAPQGSSPFPPVNGAAPAPSAGAPGSFPINGAAPVSSAAFERAPGPQPGAGPSDDCMKGFMPLREEAEKRGKL